MNKKKLCDGIAVICMLCILCVVPKQTAYAKENKIVQIALGESTTMALDSGGSLWAWGKIQLGDIFSHEETKPIKVMDGVKYVDGSGEHFAIIKKDGSLWHGGAIYKCSTNSTLSFANSKFTKIMTNVKSVSVYNDALMAVKKDGSLWSWGHNKDGKLADGTTKNHTKPVQVMKNVKAVDIGYRHTVILKKDGSVWCVGANYFGQLGCGNYRGSLKPKAIKVMDNAKEICAGILNSAAIKKDGSLWVWGYGPVGDGVGESRNIPTQVMSHVTGVSLGRYKMAVTSDGSLWCWGEYSCGDWPDGKTGPHWTPVKVMKNVYRGLSAGNVNTNGSYTSIYSAVIKKDGSVWTWGDNSSGQLGVGDTKNRSTPTEVVIQTYKITYKAGKGKGAPASQKKKFGKALTLSRQKPTRAGYIFKGWAVKNGGKAVYQPGGKYTSDQNITLYAVWQKKKKEQKIDGKSTFERVYKKNDTFKLGVSAKGKLKYTSSNKGVISVSSKGTVTVKGYGKATITVTAAATGSYKKSTKKISVVIRPPKSRIKSFVSDAAAAAKVIWKKDGKASGYQIQYADNKKFSNSSSLIVNSKNTNQAVFKNLKKGQRYYVRVRSFKSLKGSRLYGAWSKARSVVIKVEVKKQTINVKKKLTKEYKKNGTFRLNAEAKGKLTYSSSNKSVAVVSDNGTVTMKGCGTSVITITASDTLKYKKAKVQVKITLIPQQIKSVSVTSTQAGTIRINWKKDSSFSGIQIQMSKNKDFNNLANVRQGQMDKTALKKSNAVLSGFAGKSVWYIRLRGFSTARGENIYGKWTKPARVKVK